MKVFNKKTVVLILFVAVLGFMARSGNGQDAGQGQMDAVVEDNRQAVPAAAVEKKEPVSRGDARTGVTAKVPEAAEKAVRRKEVLPRPAVPVRVKEQPAAISAPAQDQQYNESANSGGVLEIEDGIFRYARIPEKEIPEVTADSYIAPDQGAIGEIIESPGERSGLFGFGPDTTGYIAKGVLIFVIILIFIMYRLRSRSRDNRVLRRFP
ncbi:MAG TPA: hypothetical protein PLI62_03210 [Spirochaetota bacterium]|nr:hypothetical protein [Spirochaetota bacterium]